MDHSEVKHFPKIDHTPAQLDAPSRLLMDAAALIEKHGWCKYQLQDSTGKMCLRGAMHRALCGNAQEWPTSNQVYQEAIERVALSVCMGDPAEWNNDMAKDRDEVVAKLRAVAMGG